MRRLQGEVRSWEMKKRHHDLETPLGTHPPVALGGSVYELKHSLLMVGGLGHLPVNHSVL